jgi:catechol 2,3-dioxygenase-like lactoylglutathione lyase family enzyme
MDHVGILVDDLAAATEFVVELGLAPHIVGALVCGGLMGSGVRAAPAHGTPEPAAV